MRALTKITIGILCAEFRVASENGFPSNSSIADNNKTINLLTQYLFGTFGLGYYIFVDFTVIHVKFFAVLEF